MNSLRVASCSNLSQGLLEVPSCTEPIRYDKGCGVNCMKCPQVAYDAAIKIVEHFGIDVQLISADGPAATLVDTLLTGRIFKSDAHRKGLIVATSFDADSVVGAMQANASPERFVGALVLLDKNSDPYAYENAVFHDMRFPDMFAVVSVYTPNQTLDEVGL